MPQAGVSVPRGKVHRGDRWSDDLELEFPMRRARSERRPERPRVAPVLALEDDPYGPASSTAPERRTVIIQGRPEDRYRPTPSARRRQPPPHQRVGFQPDRVAMWAVLLGLVLLLVAAASSHAAVIGAHGLASLALR